MFDKDGKLDERSQRVLSKQTIPPRYGLSPGMQAMAEPKTFTSRRPDGSFHVYTVKDGKRALVASHGLIVTHPDRPPKLVRWDGSEEPITNDAD